MTDVVVVSGNPRPNSRTLTLGRAVGLAIAEEFGHDAPAVIDVGALGTGLLMPDDPDTDAAVATLTGAGLLVVATPTYKGTYTGILKVLLDRLPQQALAGQTTVPVVTAAIQPQADATEAALRALLGELGSTDVRPGLTVLERDLDSTTTRVKEYAAALRSLAG